MGGKREGKRRKEGKGEKKEGVEIGEREGRRWKGKEGEKAE